MDEFALDAFARVTAIKFVLGLRPAGGPYRLIVTDDHRWKGNDYALSIELWEDEHLLVYRGRVTRQDLIAALRPETGEQPW